VQTESVKDGKTGDNASKKVLELFDVENKNRIGL
jgi:hypothetical protein